MNSPDHFVTWAKAWLNGFSEDAKTFKVMDLDGETHVQRVPLEYYKIYPRTDLQCPDFQETAER